MNKCLSKYIGGDTDCDYDLVHSRVVYTYDIVQLIFYNIQGSNCNENNYNNNNNNTRI